MDMGMATTDLKTEEYQKLNKVKESETESESETETESERKRE